MEESLWTAGVSDFDFPTMDKTMHTQVLVIGGGLAGLLTGYMLTQADVDCIVIDANRICGGTTGNTTAKITSQHGMVYHKIMERYGQEATKLYWQANQEAIAAYRELCKNIPCDFQSQNAYVYSTRAPEILNAELTALRQAHIPCEYVNTLPLPFPITGAIRFRNQAQFHPVKFASAIAKQLTIFQYTRALSIEDGCVQTNHGEIFAEHIVVTTHFPLGKFRGLFPLKLYQDRSYVLALRGAPIPIGMFLDESPTGLSFRGYEDYLLLGGGAHRTGMPGGGWNALESFAAEHYPNATISHRWAAQDCMTLDAIPYIGKFSKHSSNLWVATGFQKWGMTGSMVAAMLLRNQILDVDSPYTQLYSPSRSTLHPQLLSNLKESGKHLFTRSKPRCTHLGCALKWNQEEHSWDCPCHGSRFTESGKLIDNPANKALKKQNDRKA